MSKLQIAIISVLALIACSTLFVIALVTIPFQSLVPAKPTPILYEFIGNGGKVESFTVFASGPTLLTGVHQTQSNTRLLTIYIKDESGNRVSSLIVEGNSDRETVANLAPGNYFLEINGDKWHIILSPGQ